MAYGYTPPRPGAGPFGYTLGDLSSRTPEEHDEFEREVGALENKLQWGFEPGRWQKGSAWHDQDWPEAKLVSGGDLAGLYDNRNDLIAETGEFKSMLGEAKKVWKSNAGLNSPLLPVLASLPNQERERVRNQSAKFRELVAFGDTPDRWETGIRYMRNDGHLLDPDADTERLMDLWETKDDLLPHLDATDHALDYLDELEKQGDVSPRNGLPSSNLRDHDPNPDQNVQSDLTGFAGRSSAVADNGGPQLAQAGPAGTDADRWAYGEIREWANRSTTDFSASEGLADTKASIAAVCRRGNRCESVDGSNATAREDQAAWNNIVNATGGTDQSGGGNFMCVDREQCWFVHSCYRCVGGVRQLVPRDRPLESSGTVTVRGHTVYFYNDPLLGWCNREDYMSGCS